MTVLYRILTEVNYNFSRSFPTYVETVGYKGRWIIREWVYADGYEGVSGRVIGPDYRKGNINTTPTINNR